MQEYAETIAEVLCVDVTVVDENCIRICGTGLHRENIGLPVPHGSFFQKIIKTGKPGVICDVKKEYALCQNCSRANTCKELATMGFPIFKKDKPIGVLGLSAFTEEQKNKIINTTPELINFLKHMSNLLESKLLLIEANERLQNQIMETMNEINKNFSFEKMIGKEACFTQVLLKAQQIAQGTSTVLIRGESGTGKEFLARAIHAESPRKHRPFIAVNCASIPENLLESELFGYEGGAFTGAKKGGKLGKFELAQGGTIFLDEVGDMPLSLQPKILRVLQEKSIDRVGGDKAVSVDVRVIAATHANLEAMIKNGKFREDLYYRLNVIPLELPPLRERRGDIPLYLEHFLKKFSKMLNKKNLVLDPSLVEWLKTYRWSGNIRQLENVVEYMVNMNKTGKISFPDLPEYLEREYRESLERMSNYNSNGSFDVEVDLSLEERVARYEKSILQNFVHPGSSTNDKLQAAHALKISLATLYRKLKKHQI
jgi:transcriptional regulator with PAS, ATPase and Fis domain